MSSVQTVDAAYLLASPPPKIAWAIEGILPVGTVGDIFGPPGGGKSSITLDLAIAVAAGSCSWFGLPCISGPVVLLGGERSGIDAFSRDLHRASQGRSIEPDRLFMPQDANGDCPPLWTWNKKADCWTVTDWGKQITEWLVTINPALILVDTLASAASGSDIINQPQQYALGITIRQWAKTIDNSTVLTISHTNQASSTQELANRLHYLSRAGGNGLPGAVRWIAGVALLNNADLDMVPGGREYDPDDKVKRFIALAVSKHNEMPAPAWTPMYPVIFQMKPNGGLVLVPTNGAAFDAYYPSVDDARKPREKQKKKTDVNPNLSLRDNEYLRAKNGANDERW